VPGNCRIYHIELTGQGRRLVEQIEPLYIMTIHEVMGDLGEEGCRELVEGLDAIRGKAARIRRCIGECNWFMICVRVSEPHFCEREERTNGDGEFPISL